MRSAGGMLPRMLISHRIRRREDAGALQLAEADRRARARGALDAAADPAVHDRRCRRRAYRFRVILNRKAALSFFAAFLEECRARHVWSCLPPGFVGADHELCLVFVSTGRRFSIFFSF